MIHDPTRKKHQPSTISQYMVVSTIPKWPSINSGLLEDSYPGVCAFLPPEQCETNPYWLVWFRIPLLDYKHIAQYMNGSISLHHPTNHQPTEVSRSHCSPVFHSHPENPPLSRSAQCHRAHGARATSCHSRSRAHLVQRWCAPVGLLVGGWNHAIRCHKNWRKTMINIMVNDGLMMVYDG